MRENIRMLFVILVCVIVVTACTPTVEETVSAEAAPTQLEQTQLASLALRLIPIYGPNGEVDSSNARLLPGEVPANLDIPLPPETAVVGSFLDGYGGTQIVLDINLPSAEIMTFYEEALINRDWEKAPEPSSGNGFILPEMGRTYCRAEDKESLWLVAVPVENGSTDVQIAIKPEQAYSPCEQTSYGYGLETMGAQALIPVLEAPPGVRQASSGSSSGGDDEASTFAYLNGEQDLQETITHYNAQLEAYGWTLLETMPTDSLIVTSWTFQDEEGQDWFGTLSAYQWPEAADSTSMHLEILKASD